MNTNIALLAPIVLLSLLLMIVCLIDLWRRQQVRGGNKWLWLGVILIGGTLGQIVYLIVGRDDS